ncbi:hypothetical protein QTO34_013094 [Cnephaeus nilssonii]|uniref:Uncharacterized protein n=1 Tax=Cnephaeus nilssonii TaxID=3371016 RepID=A0AA40HAD9_CNENI|nr:hypothetical protein QTO34_013094 [Eptesicus nilssonii]
MASLVDVASFLVILRFACCEDAHVGEKLSPVFNLRLDPRTKTLTWNSRGNVTEQGCRLDTPPAFSTRQHPQAKGDSTYFCWFPNAVLHRGARLTVEGTADGSPFQSVLEFHNPGREGSGAVNFSCLIYNLRLMRCSWNPGPAAPADVQYQLYGWTSGREDVVECPRYVADSLGTRVGCRFDELVGSQLTDTYFFWVNGTSVETPVRFTDVAPVRGIQIEKFDPPANLTVSNNGSHHAIRWDPPRLRFEVSSHILYYELDIQREGSSSKQDSPPPSSPVRRGLVTHGAHGGPSVLRKVFLRGSEENVYLLPSASTRSGHTVRARVRFVHSELWSDWTSTVSFGLPDQDVGGLPVALLGMVVGAAALVITVLMFLCTKFSLAHKLFPAVPQVKREVVGTAEAFLEVAWDGAGRRPSLQEAEDILSVEDVRPVASGRGDPVGPDSPQHLGPE